MFGFLKVPLEQRMFPLIWPRTDDLLATIPPGHTARAHPVALQATLAIPNLAIAATLLFKNLPRATAQATMRRMEATMFDLIAADQADYAVSGILRLESEQKVWLTQLAMLGIPVGSETDLDMALGRSNLDTILRVVYPVRLEQYQQECRKGFLLATTNGAMLGQYGELGFLAKRFLSDTTGHPIFREDDLLEEGFENLGAVSLVLTGVFRALAREVVK